MKARVKSVGVGGHLSWFAKVGHEIEIINHDRMGFDFIDGDTKQWARWEGSHHLGGGDFELITDAGDESEERVESMMLHGTEG